MALFIDGPAARIEDLTNQDSGLLEVCRSEQINASTKLALAHQEIAIELEALFESQRTIYSFANGQPTLDVAHLAINGPLIRWQTFHTLAVIYRDAYFNQLNDRYQAKWRQFESLAKGARRQFEEIGAGVVVKPLRKPDGPSFNPSPATEAGGTFYFAVSLLNAAGEESCGSEPRSFVLDNGNALEVTVSSVDGNATGWNVYAGTNPSEIYLQNDTDLGLDEVFVFYPSTVVSAGQKPGGGQAANFTKPLLRRIQRG